MIVTTAPSIEDTDGLCRTQRAIVAFLSRAGGEARCSALIEDLLAARDCPSDLNTTQIDAVLMSMSNSYICNRPIIDLVGQPGNHEGWISGAVYRMVSLNNAGRGLLFDAPDNDNWWNLPPLRVRYPYALLYGSASWEAEADDIPADYWSQGGLRMRCQAIHCLGACEAYLKTATGEPPPRKSERNPIVQVGSQSIPVGSFHSNANTPHGSFVRFVEADSDRPESQAVYVKSVPILRWKGIGENEHENEYAIVEPACGRHIGDELQLFESLDNCRIVNEPSPEPGWGSPQVVAVTGAVPWQSLESTVPIVPLNLDCYRAMLSEG